MSTPVGDFFGFADWEVIVDQAPTATLVVGDVEPGAPDSQRRRVVANAAARQLLGVDRYLYLDDVAIGRLFDEADIAVDEDTGVAELTGSGLDALLSPESSYTIQVKSVSAELTMAQITPCPARREIDRILAEQQRFRAALMELSELAFEAEDDDEFYQRLIERAVQVVPGAQGGSVQLNIAGTAKFRFVAAVGYDLEGLKRHALEQQHFFRNAWDPKAQIVRDFSAEGRSEEITEWLETVGRLSEIVVNVSAPVLSAGFPVAFLSLDNFEDPDAITETSVEMTTVLSRLIGELWRRRELEAEVRKEREAFRHLAMHDPLTGLPNRRNLERTLSERMTSTGQRGFPSAVLFLDVDDFKGVNDRLGHDIGDRLLKHVADGVGQAVRAGDVVGRWGGDEFLVIPHRLDTPDEAMDLAGRILHRFEDEADLGDGVMHRVRLTVGVGWSFDTSVGAEGLVRIADEALYEAKSAGKGIARLNKA